MSRKAKSIHRRAAGSANRPLLLRRWWAKVPQERRRAAAGIARRVVLLGALVALVGSGMKWLEAHVLTGLQDPPNAPVRVQLNPRPGWMPAELARSISRSLVYEGARYGDKDLSERVYHLATANPWVRGVRAVRKYHDVGGRCVVRVQGEFRQPVALAAWKGRYYFVDEQGVRLGDSGRCSQVPQWVASIPTPGGGSARRVYFAERSHVPAGARAWRKHYMIIELNDKLDPAAPALGKPWDSKALRAGLRLVKLLASRRYARQITRLDVRNYAGRVSKNLEYLGFWSGRTYIKFGRFPHPDGVDWVVPPQRKMANLDRYVALHDGRLAGTAGLDLQIDNLNDSTYGMRPEGR